MFCSHLLTSSLFKKILLSKIPIQVGRSGKETLSLFPRWCREAGRVRSRLVLLQSREQSWISSRQLDPTATWCVPCGGVGGGGGHKHPHLEPSLPILAGVLRTRLWSLSHVRPFVTPWTLVHQAPLSMGFSRREYWSGLPFPSPLVNVRRVLYPLEADRRSSPPREAAAFYAFLRQGHRNRAPE